MLGYRGGIVGMCLFACRGPEPIELPPEPRLTAGELEGSPVQQLALGLNYTCASLTGGAVKCWGSHEYGVINPGMARVDVSAPSSVGPLDFGDERAVVQVSAGWRHACVVFEDARARCWGRNDNGQLGQGNTEDYGDDGGETLAALADIPLTGVIRISAGVSSTCAVIREGEGMMGSVHCWGSDVDGAIGDASSGAFGDDEPVDASRQVLLPELATDVAAGDSVSCARLLNGAVHCWGSNAFRTLGIGETPCNVGDERICEGSRHDSADRPVQGLVGSVVSALQLNQAHACAVDDEGALWCWGRNDQSRAGYPHEIYGTMLGITPGPVRLGDGVVVVSVGLGTRHGCAVDVEGAIRCWGEAGPQLGYGTAQNDGVAGIGGAEEPSAQYELMGTRGIVQLGDTDGVAGNDPALRVFSGGHHNCALLASGSVRCWGSNTRGELGYGDFADVGQIGDRGSPADSYAALGRHGVCLGPPAPEVTTPCAN